MNCPSCEKTLSENASFCGKCRTQVKCLSCDHSLGSEDVCCEVCGTEIKKRSNGEAMNKIRYDGRTFEAEFTDNVGKDVTETFGQIIINNQRAISNGENVDFDQDNEETFDISAEEVDDNPVETKDNRKKQQPAKIETVLRETNGDLDVLITRLNAKGKTDYAARLTYLIVLFYREKGVKEVEKAIINKLLKVCGVYDRNYRRWFSSAKAGDFLVKGGKVEFRPAGLSQAQLYLDEVFAERGSDTWDLSMIKSGASSSTKSKSGTSTPKSNVTTTAKSIVQEKFDAHHKTKTLKKLFDEKDPGKNTNRIILTIAYYLHEILGVSSFSDGNIDYAYRTLGLTNRPKHLRQTITNMKNRKVWFEDAEEGKWKLSRNGEIYVENGFSD